MTSTNLESPAPASEVSTSVPVPPSSESVAVATAPPTPEAGEVSSEAKPAAVRPTKRVKVLVADDDPVVLASLRKCLQYAGYEPITAEDGEIAQQKMTDDVAVALIDLEMPKADGFSCLDFFRRNHPDTQVIVVTGSEDVTDAVNAMKQGAVEYVTKPFVPDQLIAYVRQASKNAQLISDNRGLRRLVEQARSDSQLPAKSKAARDLSQQIDRIAALESTILLTGESGTGKTTAARMIHDRGPRSDAPFVAINCASLPRELIEAELFGHCRGAFTGAITDRPGRAEIADGGTLFLDEIGDLPLDLQPKLLTFLQDRTLQRIGSNETRSVNVRLIVATHQDLSKMCEERKFRQDLFYRLNVLPIEVPALRDRVEDIPDMVETILSRISTRRGEQPISVDEEAKTFLQHYPWPGNIRELENVLERAAAFCTDFRVTKEDISLPSPSEAGANSPAAKTLACRTLFDIERQAIIETLEACKGNKAKTARTLGISEKSIYNKMRRHGMIK